MINNIRYFVWLMEKIPGVNRQEAKRMFEKEFYAVIPNDGNRITDGYNLRQQYMFEKNEQLPSAEEEPVTFLEVMIVLAEKMSYLMEDKLDPEVNDAGRWFTEMLDHLGKPRDRMKWDEYRWDDAMETVMNRMYSSSGAGGLFPRINPEKDQRKVELWYQMNGYLMDWYG